MRVLDHEGAVGTEMVNLQIRQVKLEGWSDTVTVFIQCPYPSTDTLADEFFYYVKNRHAFRQSTLGTES